MPLKSFALGSSTTEAPDGKTRAPSRDTQSLFPPSPLSICSITGLNEIGGRAPLEEDGAGIVLRWSRGPQGHELGAGNVQSLAHRLYPGQVGRARRVRGIKMVQRHAIIGQSAHSRFDRSEPAILADFRSFAGQQI